MMTRKQMNLKQMLARVERDYICNDLARTKGNVALSARNLDVPLSTLWFKIERLGIDPAGYRNK